MKIPLALLFGLAFELVVSCSVFAQATTKPSPAKVQTTEDLRKALLATTWTWERSGTEDEYFKVLADGSVRASKFHARFDIKNPHEIELRIKKTKAILRFNEDYTQYEGVDFDGLRPIRGRPVKPKLPASTAK